VKGCALWAARRCSSRVLRGCTLAPSWAWGCGGSSRGTGPTQQRQGHWQAACWAREVSCKAGVLGERRLVGLSGTAGRAVPAGGSIRCVKLSGDFAFRQPGDPATIEVSCEYIRLLWWRHLLQLDLAVRLAVQGLSYTGCHFAQKNTWYYICRGGQSAGFRTSS